MSQWEKIRERERERESSPQHTSVITQCQCVLTLCQRQRESASEKNPTMAFSCRLDSFIISSFEPHNSIAPSSIHPSLFLSCPSSFKPQKLLLPLRIRSAPTTIRATSSSSSSSPATIAEPEGIKVFFFSLYSLCFFNECCVVLIFFFFFHFLFVVQINSIPTKPIEGQKTGTSGLRKKVSDCSVCWHVGFEMSCFVVCLARERQ